jgi:hypothetical protein
MEKHHVHISLKLSCQCQCTFDLQAVHAPHVTGKRQALRHTTEAHACLGLGSKKQLGYIYTLLSS